MVKGNGPDTNCQNQYAYTSHSGRSPPGPWTTRCGSSSVVANTQDSQHIAGQWNPLKHGGRAAHDVFKARAAEPSQLRIGRRTVSGLFTSSMSYYTICSGVRYGWFLHPLRTFPQAVDRRGIRARTKPFERSRPRFRLSVCEIAV